MADERDRLWQRRRIEQARLDVANLEVQISVTEALIVEATDALCEMSDGRQPTAS